MRAAFFGAVVFGCVFVLAERAAGSAAFVKGAVPDWNQPYFYTPGLGGNGGPGPDPHAGAVNQWNAWCAPTSASNLAGHWADYHGNGNVADTTPFPGSTVNWAVGPSWQDYLGHSELTPGNPRPAPRAPGAGGPPYAITDIGWYMDTNRNVPYDAGGGFMGGDDLGNPGHVGTYLKDIHVGLANHLLTTDPLTPWTTGTQGKAFAGGTAPDGTPAVLHLAAASAFGEVVSEIDRNHTMILSYIHWTINPTGFTLAPTGGLGEESSFGGICHTWGTWSGPTIEDEQWNEREDGLALGHAVTAVGYIRAGDPDDMGAQIGLGPTDWVIVHDNWPGSVRNVIIPFNFVGTWVANTNAVPEPGVLLTVAGGVAVLLLRRRARRA